jgi:hypothetical protein
VEALADAQNQSTNPYCPLQELLVDEAVSGVEGVEASATAADSEADGVADLEGVVVVAALENEVASETEVVSGEVAVAFEVDETMATGRFRYSTQSPFLTFSLGVAEVEALASKGVDLAVMVLLMGMALQVLKVLVVRAALAVLHNKVMDHQAAASDQVEVDIVETSSVKDLVGTMTGTLNDRDTSCGRVRYIQFSHCLSFFLLHDSALGGVCKYGTPLLSHCSAAFA